MKLRRNRSGAQPRPRRRQLAGRQTGRGVQLQASSFQPIRKRALGSDEPTARLVWARLVSMSDLKARVTNGRLVLDEATDLPEGTEVDLVPADWWDDLTDDDRRRLEDALARSEMDAAAGRVKPASEVLRSLRSQE